MKMAVDWLCTKCGKNGTAVLDDSDPRDRYANPQAAYQRDHDSQGGCGYIVAIIASRPFVTLENDPT